MKENEIVAVEFKPKVRKPVRFSSVEMVKRRRLYDDLRFPLVVEPNAENVNLVAWAEEQRDLIERELSKYGTILFRGFEIESAARFEQFINATSGGPLEYHERSSPRSQVSGNIYTSTDYPAEQSIFLHNEQSYNATFLRKIYFFCMQPAAQGGETPLANTRKIFAAIDPKIRDRFIEKGYMYVRNFSDGLGLSWQTAFQTTSRAVVEQYCRQRDIQCEWRESGLLRTRQIRQVIARHPQTDELVWFNHATFFHISTLPPAIGDRLLMEFGAENLPNNTYYGDGSPIEPTVMDELRAAYLQEKVIFPWSKGDVLMLDNMLTSHGREPFVGPRKVVAGMADPHSWKDIRSR